jgi:hypothetical protein
VPIPALPEEHVTVLRKAERRSRPGIRCHYAPAAEVYRTSNLRVSGPTQLFVELATQLPLVDLVVVGDRLVRDGRVTLRELGTFCQQAKGPGATHAREAAAYVREGVDSPMETRLRLLLVLAGLPEPQVNRYVGESGVAWRKYDLCWPEAKLIAEYDGRHHIEREEQWEADLARREGIDDDGWRTRWALHDGGFEVRDGRVVTTGGPFGPTTLCDSAARWDATKSTSGQQPVWVNYTGRLLARSQLDVRTRLVVLAAQYTMSGNPDGITDVAQAVPEADLVFIAVGTPQGEDGSADLQYVLGVALQNHAVYKIARALVVEVRARAEL